MFLWFCKMAQKCQKVIQSFSKFACHHFIAIWGCPQNLKKIKEVRHFHLTFNVEWPIFKWLICTYFLLDDKCGNLHTWFYPPNIQPCKKVFFYLFMLFQQFMFECELIFTYCICQESFSFNLQCISK